MSGTLHKKTIMKKTVQVALLTALSRVLGVTRAVFQLRYLGLSALSDAFLMAFRISNFLRKVFAEGALSAAFVPTFVDLIKQGKRSIAYSLMTYSFLVFEGGLLLCTLFVWLFPQVVMRGLAPGFSPEQVAYAIPLLRILFPFILFISSSALLAGALHAVHCFGVNAFAPVLFNIFYIVGLLICVYYKLSSIALAFFIVTGGAAHFLLHLIYYFKFSFEFGALTRNARHVFFRMLSRFGPALLGVSMFELNVMLDSILASYLPAGSVTMLHYGGRFMGVPLGVFGVAFSTILLPQFSRTRLTAPSRLPYYLLESAKFIFWLMVPSMAALMFFAPQIFLTFLGVGTHAKKILLAAQVLRVYTVGLLFFSINKIIMNMLYALHDTWVPTWGTLYATVLNIIGNSIAVYYGSVVGIALSTVVSGVVVTIFSIIMLARKHNVRFYIWRFLQFVPQALFHALCGVMFYSVLHMSFFRVFVPALVPEKWFLFVAVSYGYWLLVAPLILLSWIVFYLTRKYFGIRIYFIN